MLMPIIIMHVGGSMVLVTRYKALDTLEDPPILEDLPIIEDPSWKNNAKDILEDPSHR
jgi:hypothetical protein